MPLPTEAELLSEIAQLKSYTQLYRNGYLPGEVLIAAFLRVSLGNSSVGAGGGTSDATAANQVLQTTRLTEIRDKPSGDSSAANQLIEILRLSEVRDSIIDSNSSLADLQTKATATNVSLVEIRDRLLADIALYASAANQQIEITRLTEIRDRLIVNSGRLLVSSETPVITSVTETVVSVALTNTPLLSANSARKDAILINNSPNDVYLSRGGTAVANQGIYLQPNGGVYEINTNNLFQGAISAIAVGAVTPIMTSEGV